MDWSIVTADAASVKVDVVFVNHGLNDTEDPDLLFDRTLVVLGGNDLRSG
jgi:hypothetical protein